MLERVSAIARSVATDIPALSYVVATDDQKIETFCYKNQIPVIMTPISCQSGSDRVMAAALKTTPMPDYIINLQGDMPFLPAAHLRQFIESMMALQSQSIQVFSLCVPLEWPQLDRLRELKKATPMSGTTVVTDQHQMALWFSKNILPALRDEAHLRKTMPLSPVLRHIGIYGYHIEALKEFCQRSPSYYETHESLEQLRFLENNIPIKMIRGKPIPGFLLSGIDSPEDVARAEDWLSLNRCE